MQVRPKMTLEQYAALLAAELSSPLPTEKLPIDACLNRVLATDETSLAAIPPFTNSAMDGFAIRQADPTPLPIAFEIFAGDTPAPLPPGQAARIMTGAPIPDGADTVVPIEDCNEVDNQVTFTASPKLGQHIRHVGEDLRPGDPVLARGATLLPQHLAAAASAGLTTLTVTKPPTIAVVVTGDEIAPNGPTLQAHIPDSNGPYLTAAIHRIGACPVLTFSPDDPSALRSTLGDAALHADLIIVTGGASAGDRDVARDVLTEAGCQFVHVAMQPGKPQGHGTWQGTPIFALPGNPVSVAVSWTMLIRPAIDAWLGRLPAQTRWGVATRSWTTPDARAQLMPVALDFTEDGRTLVRPSATLGSGSHLIGSLARAQALAWVPAEVERVQPGDVLRLVTLD